ncbi:hypothetical protein ACFY97_06595 [Streptomyces klenkii]|uniref:hypothetical protein n=1 Tax=Streptomyces klenkii TaxID=1420899 RepID=UPI0036E9BBB4
MTAVLDTPVIAVPVLEEPDTFEVLDRRRPGEGYPRIPAGWVELTRGQAAAALFEASSAQSLREFCRMPHEELRAVLANVAGRLGAPELAALTREFVRLDVTDRSNSDVVTCWWLAHKLCVETWFTNARARLMTHEEAAVCLYLAGEERLPRQRRDEYLSNPRPDEEISTLVCEFASTLPAEDLRYLAQGLFHEVNPPHRTTAAGPEFLPLTAAQRAQRRAMRQAMPDYNRRRFCHRSVAGRLFVWDWSLRAPLMVESAAGDVFLGPVVPQCPEKSLHALAQQHGRVRAMGMMAGATA